MNNDQHLWLEDRQREKYNITDQDLKDCHYDRLRCGYWVPKGSPAEIILTLKGLTLRKKHYDLDRKPTDSPYFGTEPNPRFNNQ